MGIVGLSKGAWNGCARTCQLWHLFHVVVLLASQMAALLPRGLHGSPVLGQHALRYWRREPRGCLTPRTRVVGGWTIRQRTDVLPAVCIQLTPTMRDEPNRQFAVARRYAPTKLAAPRPDCSLETGRIPRGWPRCQALRSWRTWSQVCAPPNMLALGPGAAEGGGEAPHASRG